MNTYIRTMDKKMAYKTDIFEGFKVHNNKIIGVCNLENPELYEELGIYSTDDKALKALDKLIYWINHISNYNIGNIQDPNYRTISSDVPCVFQMPQESEVF